MQPDITERFVLEGLQQDIISGFLADQSNPEVLYWKYGRIR